jgi:hypothetical protein
VLKIKFEINWHERLITYEIKYARFSHVRAIFEMVPTGPETGNYPPATGPGPKTGSVCAIARFALRDLRAFWGCALRVSRCAK